MKEETKPEMTVEEFMTTWAIWDDSNPNGKAAKNMVLSDLRSVIRGELIRYDHYLTTGMREYVFGTPRESDVDDFMNENWIE